MRLRPTTSTALAACLLALLAPATTLAAPLAASGSTETPSEEEPSEGSSGEAEQPSPEDFPGLEPITGAPELSEATPITAGRYVDTFPADFDEARIYEFERTIPGSFVSYGLTLLDDSRDRSVIMPMLLPGTSGDDVVTCGNVVRQPAVAPSTMPVTSYGGISLRTGERCRNADSLIIGVGPGEGNPPEAGTPYELTVWETPEPTNVEDLQTPSIYASEDFEPVAAEEVTQQVVPGPTRSEAPLLGENGGYHVDLPLGEVAWVAMEVPVGNLLAVEAVVEDLQRTDQGATVEARISGPGGGWAGASQINSGFSLFERTFGSLGVVGVRPTTFQAQTSDVGPNALVLADGGASRSNEPIVATGGVYYVALYAQDLTGEDDATLPVTLTADVLGVDQVLDDPAYANGQEPEPLPPSEGAGEGPTEYDGAAAQAERVAAAEEAAAEEEAADQEAVEDGSIPWWVWVLGVLVLLGIAVLAVVLARRGGKRKQQGSHQGPPQGPPPGGWGGPPGPGPGGPGWGPGPGPGGPGPGWGPPPNGPGAPGAPGGWQQGPQTPPTVIRPGGPSDSGGSPAPQPPPGQAGPDQDPPRWEPGPGRG